MGSLRRDLALLAPPYPKGWHASQQPVQAYDEPGQIAAAADGHAVGHAMNSYNWAGGWRIVCVDCGARFESLWAGSGR